MNKTNLYGQFVKMVKKHMHVDVHVAARRAVPRPHPRFPNLINNDDRLVLGVAEDAAPPSQKLLAREARSAEGPIFDGTTMCSKIHSTVHAKSRRTSTRCGGTTT